MSAKLTSATSKSAGSWDTKACAAFCAATKRFGCTSSASIDLDVSRTSAITGVFCALATRNCATAITRHTTAAITRTSGKRRTHAGGCRKGERFGPAARAAALPAVVRARRAVFSFSAFEGCDPMKYTTTRTSPTMRTVIRMGSIREG